MKHLRELRRLAGFKTAKEAAKKLEISLSMLYHAEEGINKPSIKLAAKMTDVYACSFDQIFLPYAVINNHNDESKEE